MFFRAALLAGLSACAPVSDHEIPHNAQTFKPELLEVGPDSYRSVGYSFVGPDASISSSNAAWEVTRDWADVTDEAGVAWGSNSGLTWDEKYSAWVDSMGQTTSDDGNVTVELITPWGRALPSPSLECAEMAMFLRITFAAWYELPFFMSAWSSTHGNIHFGHFGIVDPNGDRVSGYPRFATTYDDYRDDMAGMTDADILANWPDDTNLETKYLTSAKDDEVEFLGPDAYAGAYFDEIFLNKRAGHFLLRLLVNFGSMHLASAKNTWNLEPDAIREGDMLLHRWQSQGIGHAMVIKTVEELQGGNLDAEIIFGSMPRIQPVWYNAAVSKSYFLNKNAGSGQTNVDGDIYSHLGGGIKRWRTPVQQGGHWVNIVPVDDRDDWIGSTDYPALEARIETCEQILGSLTPSELRDAALARIEIARDNLRQRPASCANRERREDAFDDLYDVMTTEFGMSRSEVDESYRILDDYIFEELVYTESKTCCWNSTTPEMADIIVQYNTEQIEDAHANGQCLEPTVFRARDNGGYDPFESYAASIGRSSDWVAWSEDETCPQRNVLDDTEANPTWTPFCDYYEGLMGYGCNNPSTWYTDQDGDGYGDSWSSVSDCSQPSGTVSNADDCDDSTDAIRPGATEVCDNVDNNCDGQVDEGCPTGSNGGSGGTGGNNNNGGSGGGGTCSGLQLSTGGLLTFSGFGLLTVGRRFR